MSDARNVQMHSGAGPVVGGIVMDFNIFLLS